jgi:hydrogenase maturation protein HypF
VPDPIVRDAWQRRLNAPQSSAAGRVFDAAAAVVLGVTETSFEGQGPMWLEAIAGPVREYPRLHWSADAADGLLRLDWAPLLAWLSDTTTLAAAALAGAVHASMAAAIVSAAERLREESGCRVVGLTGGVFQNRLLCELATEWLGERGFRVLLAAAVPPNDGGLSYGQVAEFLGRLR